ncbi:hypothetical protein KGF57_002937 [Candida theae]|uniref:Uncharacterized protein n=1 Tax=Candida theae TaxID=1198502 RepID=A0AAD5BE83_9ASCO|nr:uncharacterized protein KGF57_002937 [Candida theae]KAI5957671.1 hypothetical protein KGF57_002937 [Candida theae]
MIRPTCFRISKRTLFQSYTEIPRNSYVANKTYPLLIWNNLIPYQLKYLSGLGAGVLTFINLHPQIWITLGPPISIAGYYLNRKIKHNLYEKNANQIVDRTTEEQGSKYPPAQVVKILPYDESQLYNIQEDIENEYDSLRRQIVDLVGKRIVEHITSNPNSVEDNEILSSFMKDSQFNVHFFENEFESWVTSQAKIYETNRDDCTLQRFIKASLPYYSERNVQTRKRLGVVSVYMLKLDEDSWAISLEISPIGWKSKSTWIRGVSSMENMESELYKKFKNV